MYSSVKQNFDVHLFQKLEASFADKQIKKVTLFPPPHFIYKLAYIHVTHGTLHGR